MIKSAIIINQSVNPVEDEVGVVSSSSWAVADAAPSGLPLPLVAAPSLVSAGRASCVVVTGGSSVLPSAVLGMGRGA